MRSEDGEPLGEPPPTSSRPLIAASRPPDMEIMISVSCFEKIRTITAQIFLYRKLILPSHVINTLWPFSTSKKAHEVLQLRVVLYSFTLGLNFAAFVSALIARLAATSASLNCFDLKKKLNLCIYRKFTAQLSTFY